MFAANRLDALLVEVDDRRLSVFSSPPVLTDSWRTYVMKTFWTAGTLNEPTPLFWQEMSAFAWALRSRVVGIRHVLPFKNSARAQVVSAGMTSVQAFVENVRESGLASVEELLGGAALIQSDGEKRSVGPEYRATYVFDLYKAWCEKMNMRATTATGFGLVVSQEWAKRRDRTGIVYTV